MTETPRALSQIRGTAPAAPGRDAYTFETVNTKRRDPTVNLQHLYRRLGVDPAQLSEEQRGLFHRFGLDVLENIAWYEKRIAAMDEAQAQFETQAKDLGGAAMIVVLGLGLATAFLPGKSAGGLGLLGGQVAFLIGGVFTVLQNITGLRDNRGRLAVFWKASSDLKQLLYAFEERWRSKKPDEQLTADLHAQLERARQIAEEERRGYFQTYKSPADVFGSLSTGLSSLRTSVVAQQQTTAEGLQVSGLQKSISDTETLLVAARADRDGKEAYAKAIQEHGSEADKSSAFLQVEKAKAEMTRLEQLLKYLRERQS